MSSTDWVVDTINSVNKLCKLRDTSGALVLSLLCKMAFVNSTYSGVCKTFTCWCTTAVIYWYSRVETPPNKSRSRFENDAKSCSRTRMTVQDPSEPLLPHSQLNFRCWSHHLQQSYPWHFTFQMPIFKFTRLKFQISNLKQISNFKTNFKFQTNFRFQILQEPEASDRTYSTRIHSASLGNYLILSMYLTALLACF